MGIETLAKGCRMVTYEDARNHPTRAARRETNDCGVIAVSVAAGADYGDVLELMAKMGRPSRGGTPLNVVWGVLRDLGFVAVNETEKWVGEKSVRSHYSYHTGRVTSRMSRSGKVKTVVTAERYLPKRHTYLVLTGGRSACHILCVKRGKVQDWTAGRRNWVLNVWRIEPKGEGA